MALTNIGERQLQSRSLHGHPFSDAKDEYSAIKKEDKEQIKNRALEAGIIEPAPLLALHNALVIAKILRYDFPSDEWYTSNLKSYN